jgi:hypothetical protein
VKWIKLAEDYIHLKEFVLWKNEIYLLVDKFSNYHSGSICYNQLDAHMLYFVI